MEINKRVNIFIGSSSEAINIAEAVQENLRFAGNVELWTQGIFRPSSFILDDLVREVKRFDFAVFVFNPDDVTKLRDNTYNTVRDNVVFEMGLFIGKIGKERTFYIIPRDFEMHLPTDLIGFTPATYDADHPNSIAAVGAACSAIKRKIAELGKLT